MVDLVLAMQRMGECQTGGGILPQLEDICPWSSQTSDLNIKHVCKLMSTTLSFTGSEKNSIQLFLNETAK